MQNIIMLDEKEYFFLDRLFERMNEAQAEYLPRYIVLSRKENYSRIVRAAVDAELEGIQREYITEKYFENLSIYEIAQRHSVTRQSVYNVLKSAEKKLKSVLKYAYMCGFCLVSPPDSFDELFSACIKENTDEINSN